MRAWRGAVAVVVGLASLCGCATPTVSLRRGPRSYTAEAYGEVQERWTRSGRAFTIQSFLDDQLMATATYESWDFRWAYVTRYSADFRIAPEERSRLLRASLDAAEREHEFYVALAMPTRRWADLTSPTSAWRVTLVNDRRQEVLPVAIEIVRSPGVLERTYFPYITAWRQVFRVRFPTHPASGDTSAPLIDARTRYFTLRFAGPLGQLDLTWNVEG